MWKYYTIFALVLALSGVGYLYKQEIKAHGITEASLALANEEIETHKKNLEIARLAQVSLEEDTKEITLELSEAKRKLDKFRGREHILVAKPDLVAKKINASYNKFQNEVGCLTGDTNLCQ